MLDRTLASRKQLQEFTYLINHFRRFFSFFLHRKKRARCTAFPLVARFPFSRLVFRLAVPRMKKRVRCGVDR